MLKTGVYVSFLIATLISQSASASDLTTVTIACKNPPITSGGVCQDAGFERLKAHGCDVNLNETKFRCDYKRTTLPNPSRLKQMITQERWECTVATSNCVNFDRTIRTGCPKGYTSTGYRDERDFFYHVEPFCKKDLVKKMHSDSSAPSKHGSKTAE